LAQVGRRGEAAGLDANGRQRDPATAQEDAPFVLLAGPYSDETVQARNAADRPQPIIQPRAGFQINILRAIAFDVAQFNGCVTPEVVRLT